MPMKEEHQSAESILNNWPFHAITFMCALLLSIPCALILRKIHGAVKELVSAGVFKFASFAVLDLAFLESYRKPSANIYSVIPPSSLPTAFIFGPQE
ncbi:hypothetical protein AVEN_2456-1 [Araneus ventricosus]|uniref:Uncharacterized protein n=1 Tax=Araneus ventricosus TaxID=182803 RepID=A0A4Y2Q671_ARAVE|nr:hypothetical protein AVEN_2456-1 [Araneus ventricosus]